MIQSEAWYREADAKQYPKEIVGPRPHDLTQLTVTDFEHLLQKASEWAMVILMTYGASVQEELRGLVRQTDKVWREWADQRNLTPTDEVDQRRMHELELELDRIARRLHQMYQQALSHPLPEERPQEEIQLHSSKKEAWHREADERQLREVMRRVELGDGDAVAEAIRLFDRAGKPHEAIRLLQDHMDRYDVPLRAKKDFVEMIRNLPSGSRASEYVKENFNNQWLAMSIAEEVERARLSPTDPLVKEMWDEAAGFLPYVPWESLEQMPDEWLPTLTVTVIDVNHPEEQEYRELNDYLHGPHETDMDWREFGQSYLRREELMEADRGTSKLTLPLKDLIRHLRNEYEAPDRFTSSYRNKDNPSIHLQVPSYVGISAPVYRWVTGT